MLFINILGLLLIGLIVWWFWIYKPEAFAQASSDMVITAENGVYQPALIQIPANTSQTLTFLRKDKSPCAETVIFPELDLSIGLDVDKPVTIELPPVKPGNYVFHCQMQMYKGELHVE